jgi:RNA polymerase-binding transcription factor DksA
MDKTKKIKPSKPNEAKPDTRKVAVAPKVIAPVPAVAAKRPTMEKPSKKSALRDSILARKAPKKPIAFSLDEVRAIAKTVTAKAETTAKTTKVVSKTSAALSAALEKPVKPNHIKAASLADILGFNPRRTKASEVIEDKDVPEKFKRYHKILIELRKSLTEGIERHSEETLKRSVKDDAGDLSSYGQHMADAGTDTFDRDFALSLVSNEQEALSEIEAAIKRIRDGTYGICEITAKPISKERLLAVPFTRYSAEAQKQIERNRHHSRTQAGLFGESGEEGGAIPHEDGAEE